MKKEFSKFTKTFEKISDNFISVSDDVFKNIKDHKKVIIMMCIGYFLYKYFFDENENEYEEERY